MNELRLEVPRLNPLPFIVVDAFLLGTAALIGWQAPAPLGVAPLAAISLCVALGGIAALWPFVVNHARRQEEALQDRANQIEALARTVAASAEQISIAVANLPAIAENSARQLKAAEQLPASLKAQLAGMQHQLSATAQEENASLRHELDTLRQAETGKLASALDGLSRATADLARLEHLAAKHSTALDSAIAHLPKLADHFGQQASEALRRETTAAVTALHAAAAESSAALAAATAEARAAFERGVRDAVSHLATQAASSPPFPAHSINQSAVLQPAAEPTSAPSNLVALAPAPAESSSASASIQANAAPDSEAYSQPAADSSPDLGLELESAAAVSEPALTHDGFTRLVATAYIGIGNKLFIRGDGPGLRRDKGAPLQFVSIGKWRWENAELLFPAKVRLYKNDQIECTALGEFTLEPGHHHEVTATF